MPGFSKFFRKASDEERDHSLKLIEYQNMRGGKVVFKVCQTTLNSQRFSSTLSQGFKDEDLGNFPGW